MNSQSAEQTAEKKLFTDPVLIEIGSVEQLTQASQDSGGCDTFFGFGFGGIPVS